MKIIQIILLIALAIGIIEAAINLTLNQKLLNIMTPLNLKQCHAKFDHMPVKNPKFVINMTVYGFHYGSLLWRFLILIINAIAAMRIYFAPDRLVIAGSLAILAFDLYNFYNEARPLYQHLKIPNYYIKEWNQKHPDLLQNEHDDPKNQ